MVKTLKVGRHEFELTNSVPSGYHIWNIGKNMPNGYLPLVKTGGYDGHQVDTKRMYAIKISGAQTILNAIGYGPDTIAKMTAFIAKYDKSGSRQSSVNRMKKAIPIMKKIKGMK